MIYCSRVFYCLRCVKIHFEITFSQVSESVLMSFHVGYCKHCQHQAKQPVMVCPSGGVFLWLVPALGCVDPARVEEEKRLFGQRRANDRGGGGGKRLYQTEPSSDLYLQTHTGAPGSARYSCCYVTENHESGSSCLWDPKIICTDIKVPERNSCFKPQPPRGTRSSSSQTTCGVQPRPSLLPLLPPSSFSDHPGGSHGADQGARPPETCVGLPRGLSLPLRRGS